MAKTAADHWKNRDQESCHVETFCMIQRNEAYKTHPAPSLFLNKISWNILINRQNLNFIHCKQSIGPHTPNHTSAIGISPYSKISIKKGSFKNSHIPISALQRSNPDSQLHVHVQISESPMPKARSRNRRLPMEALLRGTPKLASTMPRTSAAFAPSLPLNFKSCHPQITHRSPKPYITNNQKARMQAAQTNAPVLPTLVVEDAETAMNYYMDALAATLKHVERSEGRVLHSLLETSYGLRISIVDYFPGCLVDPLAPGGLMHGLFQYVTIPGGGCDQAVERMVGVGGTLVENPRDGGCGQRVGKVVDRYGVAWIFAHNL